MLPGIIWDHSRVNAWEWIHSDPEVERSNTYPVPCKWGLKLVISEFLIPDQTIKCIHALHQISEREKLIKRKSEHFTVKPFKYGYFATVT